MKLLERTWKQNLDERVCFWVYRTREILFELFFDGSVAHVPFWFALQPGFLKISLETNL